MLKRLCNEVVLCYDSDNAGREAAEKAFRILSPQGLEVRVASLPQGEDPDSLIRKQGADAFRGIVDGAPDFLEHQIRAMLSGTKAAGMAERVRMAERVAGAIAIFSGVAQRVTAVNKVAKLLEISEEELNRMVTRAAKERDKQPQKADAAENGQKPDESAKKLLSGENIYSLQICQIALVNSEVLYWLRQQDCEAIFNEVPGTELLRLLWASKYDPLSEASQVAFMANLDRHQEAAFAQISGALARYRPFSKLEDVKEALESLNVDRLRNSILRIKSRQKQAGLSSEDQAGLAELRRELDLELKESLDRLRPAQH